MKSAQLVAETVTALLDSNGVTPRRLYPVGPAATYRRGQPAREARKNLGLKRAGTNPAHS